ncbi:MAG: dienelactone hydrolase, partial [bacterium]|nr:dienelactone hydrolase [bacterium]
MYEFKLPDLGEGIHEGEVLKWHVAPEETVEEDEPLVDVETDKAAVTIPSPRGGRVASLTGGVGDTITVGQVIAVIDDGTGVAIAAPPAEVAAAPAEAVPEAVPARPGVGRPVPAAPATRRLARELGIDINQVPPTGPGGRVTPDDVHRFAAGEAAPAVPAAPPPEALEVRAETEFAAHAASAIPFLDI